MIDQIKAVRVKIDGLALLTKEIKLPRLIQGINLGEPEYSKEVEKSYNSLILAKAWLGKVLGELGNPTPYQNDGNRKTKEDIEPTADQSHSSIGKALSSNDETGRVFNDLNYIEKVDWLRQEIEKLITSAKEMNIIGSTREYAIARTNSYNHLCEARFHLGFELQRFKESK